MTHNTAAEYCIASSTISFPLLKCFIITELRNAILP
nr:MAG TPA: hypothetical protein [Caudoviricetes sp.]